MLEDIPSLSQLIRQLQQVPYLASKNLFRVADFFLRMDESRLEQFCKVLVHAKVNIDRCPRCWCWREHKQGCSFCQSTTRDQATICVVETWHDVCTIEKTNGFSGVYHVLGGAICPLEGRGPDDISIVQLVQRVQDGNIREVILATNQTPEGEATASYIAVQLKKFNVLLSCLSRGVPVGSVLEGMDKLTIYKALAERRPF